MRKIHLKVKIKHLAAEARIIRFEELKSFGSQRDSLAVHRRTVVRDAARQAQIAYALIRGKDYRASACRVDQLKHDRDYAAVYDMVKRFGGWGMANRLKISSFSKYEPIDLLSESKVEKVA